MVFGFKLDVSRLLNRVDKIVLCNRFCFFLERTLGRIILYADVIFWLNKISGIFSPFLLRFSTMDNLVSV